MSYGSDVRLQLGIRIPMRDGIHLAGTLYLPEPVEQPLPAILTVTPYIAQSCHDQGVYFARHGYAFLAVDVRGRGDSDGEFQLNAEAMDCYDVIEWLAAQPYCSGHVAMWGLSYMGYVQWRAAAERPPHLVTIVPVAAPFRGVDSPMRNNVFSVFSMRWLTGVAGRASHYKILEDRSFWNEKFRRWFELGRPFAELDRFLGNPAPIFQEWIAHPAQGPYWDRFNPQPEQYAQLSLPILTITGIYDADQPGALAHYREHMKRASALAHSQHYLVIGPWDHAGTRSPRSEFCGLRAGPDSLIDLPGLHAQWYAWTMQGGAKPEFLRKNVAYYVMGAERWRYADSLEAVTASTIPYYLRSGALTTDAPAGEPDCYTYDPRDVSLAELESTVDPESATDQRLLRASAGRVLVYDTAPFADDTEISGFFRLVAWLAIDQPDTSFRASVYEVAADGAAILLTSDWMLARFRTSSREEQLIETQEPLRYELQRFPFTARLIRKASRLRIVIGALDSIYWQRNYNSGRPLAQESMKDARPVRVHLHHDEAHASALHVPIGHGTQR